MLPRSPWPALVLAASIAPGATAHAVELSLDGYGDFRLVAPINERSWLEGGLGKLRFGAGDSNLQFGNATAQGRALFTPELVAVVVVRADSSQRNFLLPLEGFVRYRPVSTTAWRWSFKAGAFFPPFSLENTELGWTSYWTLTPSAINSWFGDELRTIGAEGSLEWRRPEGTLTLTAAGFGWDDPAGVIMADRGWSLDDRPTALFDELREPDATLVLLGKTPPDTTPIFTEIDGRPGWYGGASWNDADDWRVQLFRYDNEANPSAHVEDYFAWHTDFWDFGASKQIGEFTAFGQALTGSTVITPIPGFSSITNFSSAYALLGWERGDWRIAARGDLFRTHNDQAGSLSENGYAVTGSASWFPKNWLRLTGEIIYIDSKRNEREVEDIAPRQSETQAQLSARIYL